MSDALLGDDETDMTASPESDTADRRVGRRIRALRLQRGRSLAELAQAAGLSIGALSQIERGLTSLKVKTLWPLAGALAVEPHSLLNDAEVHGRELYVVRRSERRSVPVWSEGICKDLLSPTGAALTGLHVRVEPGGGTATTYAHPGQEFGIVLSGEVDLEVDGQTYRLQVGDSFAFKSTLPHGFRNPGDAPCEIVWVNTVKPLDVRNGA
jgi:transcriptional regulator with XRE-family HTH domain